MSTEVSPPVLQPRLRSARAAVAVVFALAGGVFANWLARIPEVQRTLNLGDAQLGLVLMGASVGMLFAMVIVGGLIDRFSSRRVSVASAVILFLLFPALAYSASAYLSAFLLMLIGIAMGCMDVSMNAQAVYIEHGYGRSIMSSFHAAFSVGAGIGAAQSSAIIELGIPIHAHFILAALVGLILMLVSSLYLVADGGRQSMVPVPATAAARAPVFSLPGRALVPLGVIAFCSAVGEGSMADWTAVYLSGTVGTSASVAATGFAAFSATMTIGRLLGDRVLQRFPGAGVTRWCGAVSAAGLLLAISLPSALASIIGFALVGAGLSVVIPLAFSRAGNMPGIPSGRGIASVATLGYTGFLVGPPFIGLIAEITSLRISLGLVALLLACLIVLASALSTQPGPATQPEPPSGRS